MPAVAPSEFPPPFDVADVIGPPTDPEEDRIEVGYPVLLGLVGPFGMAFSAHASLASRSRTASAYQRLS